MSSGRHHASGGTPDPGSSGVRAVLEAHLVNRFITGDCAESSLELKPGDGYQSFRLKVHHYTGPDIAPTAATLCTDTFGTDNTKALFLYGPAATLLGQNMPQADWTLSFEVISSLLKA